MAKTCERWMPRAQSYCALSPGHKDRCRKESNNGRYMARRNVALIQAAEYYLLHQADVRVQQAQYYAANREEIRENQHEYNLVLRQEIFDHYGWACACCGSDDDLTLDHTNGDGATHRRELFGSNSGGTGFYSYLVTRGFPDDGYDLQVLCGPCNSSKNVYETCKLNHTQGGQ